MTDTLINIDTIAAMYRVPDLDASLFPGQSISSNFETGRVSARWFLNVDGAPRVTYFPASEWLRVEWSAMNHTINQVDAYLSSLGSFPSIMTWRCQRVDYTVDLLVDDVAPYLAALARLRAGAMQRHKHPDGVVWKAASRWVKFYDLKRHAKQGLRFEVSNHKQAVRYMAERWFGCERTVYEMTRPGRVVYVLSWMWDKLGLGNGFAQDELEVSALRAKYGQRSLAGAIHALRCIREHGVDTYKTLELMSKSGYYRWSSRLRVDGFMAAGDGLSVLYLPNELMERSLSFGSFGENLKTVSARGPHTPDENESKNVSKLCRELFQVLGVKVTAPRVKYLEESYGRYLDYRTAGIETGGEVSDLSHSHPGVASGDGSG